MCTGWNPPPGVHLRMVTISSGKDRWPRQGGCHFGHPCQVGGMAAWVQWPWQQGGQDILALTLSDRRRHLDSLGQVWKVNVCSFNNMTNHLCGDYKQFVCGLQTFCMQVTTLYVGYKPFVCGLQNLCMRVTNLLYAGYKPFVCGLQNLCMWVTNILYAGYKRFVCGLQIWTVRSTNKRVMAWTLGDIWTV